MNRPLDGEWRYSNGYLYCGTLRIMRLDFDTNPSDEVVNEIMEWVTTKLNNNG